MVLVLPMSIRAERVQDDRPEYSSFHVGNLVMKCLAVSSRIHALHDVDFEVGCTSAGCHDGSSADGWPHARASQH